MQNLAFTHVKMNFPCLLPFFKFLEVLLQGLGIIFAGDGQIYGSVISKKSDLWIYDFRQVIYVQEEQDWSKDRTLGHSEVTGISDNFSPSKATHCERPSKNALIQLRLFSSYPMLVKLKE